MITIQGQKLTKLRLGKKMTELGTEDHFVDFSGVDVPASTPTEVKDWIYSDRIISHQRLRDSMTVAEYNAVLSSCTETRVVDGRTYKVLKVVATMAGQKIETEASRMVSFERIFDGMTREQQAEFLARRTTK
jgi:hypothetical protein